MASHSVSLCCICFCSGDATSDALKTVSTRAAHTALTVYVFSVSTGSKTHMIHPHHCSYFLYVRVFSCHALDSKDDAAAAIIIESTS